MDRISNAEMGHYVSQRCEFNNSKESAYGRQEGDIYVAYSYGSHFPMYICDEDGRWWGNKDKWSCTTSRHQNQARPYHVHKWTDTETMKSIVRAGGVGGAVAAKFAA